MSLSLPVPAPGKGALTCGFTANRTPYPAFTKKSVNENRAFIISANHFLVSGDDLCLTVGSAYGGEYDAQVCLVSEDILTYSCKII